MAPVGPAAVPSKWPACPRRAVRSVWRWPSSAPWPHGPVLLIADEAHLHARRLHRAVITATLRHLVDSTGLAVLFITHDLGEAVQSCDHIVVLHEGAAAQHGRPRDIVDNPHPGYPATLLNAARRHAGAIPSAP
jgi:ABC-type dipeptide/oligopeptide/nickel transport system ATPase component